MQKYLTFRHSSSYLLLPLLLLGLGEAMEEATEEATEVAMDEVMEVDMDMVVMAALLKLNPPQ